MDTFVEKYIRIPRKVLFVYSFYQGLEEFQLKSFLTLLKRASHTLCHYIKLDRYVHHMC